MAQNNEQLRDQKQEQDPVKAAALKNALEYLRTCYKDIVKDPATEALVVEYGARMLLIGIEVGKQYEREKFNHPEHKYRDKKTDYYIEPLKDR